MKHIIKISLAVVVLLASNIAFAAGDAAAGKISFLTCSACHGANGEGNEMLKAPKIAGQQAWYILSSLQRFKNGTRGATDPAAATMVPMAKMLTDKQMENIAAYLATLK